MGLILYGIDIGQPEGVKIRTYKEDGLPSFKKRGKIKKHLHIVQHENAGSTSVFKVRNWLIKKGYGYHIIIDRGGHVHQHNDLQDKLWHAGQCNGTGIGVCLINPYYPKNLSAELEADFHPVKRFFISAASWWTHCSPRKDRRYVLPTEAQLTTLEKLTPFLTEQLGVPLDFPTIELRRGKRKITGWRLRKRPAPGIVAHRDFSGHADGRFAVEYLAECYEN